MRVVLFLNICLIFVALLKVVFISIGQKRLYSRFSFHIVLLWRAILVVRGVLTQWIQVHVILRIVFHFRRSIC